MSIYQHFRGEERAFIDQVLEWKDSVIEQYTSKLTDFLDPREQDIISTIIGTHSDVGLSFWGGSIHSERKRAFLYPEYIEPGHSDFELSFYEISYPVKFVHVEHRDVLGSLMGIGLKRDKFGDIVCKDNQIHIVVAKEISHYVELNLQSIGRASVSLKKINPENLIEVQEEWVERNTTVSSLRLDAVIAEVFRLSRNKVMPFVENKRIKVNWKIVDQASFQLQEGDYLSVRGLGRSKVITIEGKTKKDKYRLKVGIRK